MLCIMNTIPPAVDRDALLRDFGIPKDDDGTLRALAEELLEAGLAAARPKAVYAVRQIQHEADAVCIHGQRIASSIVVEKLAACHYAVPYIATCGEEAETWSQTLSDPLSQFWGDKLKIHLLSAARRALRDAVRAQCFPGAKHMPSLNPGSLPSWPLPAQETLFALLDDGAAQIGVRLTDSFLMLPTKSSSGMFFASDAAYENCQLCARADCPNRRAPFTGTAQ